EHISKRFSGKDKGKGLTRDWKGPCAQCWCGNKLYSPCDECPTCYVELRLWATIKRYPIETIEPCYWSTPSDDFEEIPNFPEPCPYESLPLEPLFGQQSDPLIIQPTITNIQVNYFVIQSDYNLINTPWWLPLLEIPSQQLLDEYNNFSPTYLCNSVWWTTPN